MIERAECCGSNSEGDITLALQHRLGAEPQPNGRPLSCLTGVFGIESDYILPTSGRQEDAMASLVGG